MPVEMLPAGWNALEVVRTIIYVEGQMSHSINSTRFPSYLFPGEFLALPCAGWQSEGNVPLDFAQ